MSWVEDAARVSVVDMAHVLGIATVRRGHAWSFACPACGAERRHPSSRDRRGAAGTDARKPTVWGCFECCTGGDALDLAAYHVAGSRLRGLRGEQMDAVRLAVEGRVTAPLERASELPLEDENAGRVEVPAPELSAFLAACVDVRVDAECAAYLARRAIGDQALVSRCAVALPRRANAPGWAHVQGTPWTESGHRLVVPLVDWLGRTATVLARAVTPDAARKSATPHGYGRRGLVMASPAARRMLVEGPRARPVKMRILEGEVDYLRAVGTGTETAVGIVSGSWTRDVASRVPDGSRIEIATDDDEAGDRYAAQIEAAMAGRVFCERLRLPAD